MSFLAKIAALASTKAALGLTVGVLAVSAAGAATEAAITGSTNPSNWGQQVVQQVDKCKKMALAAGTHGIGECVSTFASKHGQQESSDHRASDARTNGDHPTGAPASHPTGKPTDLPGGPPSGVPPTHPTGPPTK